MILKCPICNHFVNDIATVCPHCGAVLKDDVTASIASNKEEQISENFNSSGQSEEVLQSNKPAQTDTGDQVNVQHAEEPQVETYSIHEEPQIPSLNTSQEANNNNCTHIICKYCQAEIDNDSVFCPNCGRDLSQQSNHCIQCGAELSEESEFCPYCGTRQTSPTPQSNQNIPPNIPPKPTNPHKGQHRSSTSGIWWLIPALLLACLAGYLLFFQSGDDKEKDRYDDRRESREGDKDRDEDRDKDNQKAKEESDSTYQMEVSQAKQDSLQNLAKGKQVPPKKEKKQRISSRRSSPSSQQREHSIVTTGSKNLGYATFRGALKNGKPHDVNGRLVFKTSHIIDSRDLKGRVAEPGDYVIGEFSDGHLVQGIWYRNDHQVKGSIIIGK